VPRKKKAASLPNSTHEIEHEGKIFIVEVWDRYADEGKRGAHRRKIKGQIFDVALKSLADRYYFSNSPIQKKIAARWLYDKRFNSDLVSEIEKTCRANNLNASRSTRYEVAKDIKTAIKALDNAIAAKQGGTGENHAQPGQELSDGVSRKINPQKIQ
jgi:hypothetical protein